MTLKQRLIIIYSWFLRITINRRKQLEMRYFEIRKRNPDLDNPSDLSEYIMSNVLYRRNDKYAHLADKLLVRDYVKSKGLAHLLPEVYGVWDKASKVDFDNLPDKFALKTNHGCGYNIICWDKSALDIRQVRNKLTMWMKMKHNPLETHYALIKPRIFAEEFIEDEFGRYPVDYRIYCFNGRPAIIDCTRYSVDGSDLKHYIFDLDWNYLPQYSSVAYGDWEQQFPKPENLGKMLEYASVLSDGFEFLRVDLYNTGEKIYFGELTFSPSAGNFTQFNDIALRELYAKLKS